MRRVNLAATQPDSAWFTSFLCLFFILGSGGCKRLRHVAPKTAPQIVLEHSSLRYWGSGDGIDTGAWEGSTYTAVCTTVKDQGEDICEWLQYHEQVVGVGKFYILDHGSKEPLIHTIKKCFDVSKIRYIYFYRPFKTLYNQLSRPQLWGYKECLLNFGHQHQWMAFIDVDEFIVLKQEHKGGINDFLKEYEQYPGLAMNWLLFGSSGHEKRPEGGVLKNYFKVVKPSRRVHSLVKTIANTKFVARPGKDPHHFLYKGDRQAVTADMEPVSGPRSTNITHSKITLHHYVLKSKEDYKRKQARGSAMGNHKADKFFDTIDKIAQFEERSAMELADQIDPNKYKAQISRQSKKPYICV